MFSSSFVNAKFNIIVGMAIGAGLAMICKEICKKNVQLASKDTPTQNKSSD
tara:strand:- start:149 stop:301 length:153 start_codon:yes stop_codon:yes gene_type:complete